MAQALTLSPTHAERAPRLSAVVAEWFRAWSKDIFDPYRPERHYMRGPGPKWHAKNGSAASKGAARI